MTLAIMQPYFLPYVGYMQLMKAVDTFVLYDDVSFINRGWINRNKLLINGQEYLFTVPLKDASQNKRIKEVKLADDPKWRSKLLKTIEQGYRKAPYYGTVLPITEKIINFDTDSIAGLIHNSLVELNQYIGLSTTLVPTSTTYDNTHLKAQERILDICRQENATRYINPIGGMELYDKPTFAEAGIELFFIKARRVDYPQFNRNQADFIPWLSILDILMFNDPASVRTMLDEYDLI
ncbi:WbqC-like family protein [Fibrisoma limi BUZ 3]|uniref:WbqC-like family protein n=1 Tax=Fibrisoma limi BUZ 3 TaxID=1185876 RepID=I2GFX0_9BACT|nr:WbqC family protein [Fibrisoma limi]CCH52795.1 WbqC-like family protein [Fibrisoma limi BUZ 3]